MPKTGKNVSIPTKLLATGLALAVTVVVCGTAATIVASSQLATKPEPLADAPNLRQIERTVFRDASESGLLIDSLVAPLGAARSAAPEDVALLTGLFATRAAHGSAWDAVSPSSFPSPPLAPAIRTLPVRFGLDSLKPSELAAAVADTASPWLPVFRRWARSRPLPPLWGYRAGLPGVTTLSDLPERDFGAMRALFAANDLAALLALRSGHATIAMERARENLSASRHFLEQPLLYDAVIGRHFLHRAAELLALSADAAGDSAVNRQARRLDVAAARFDNSLTRWLQQEEANPRTSSAVDIAANRNLPPSIRIEAVAPIVTGGCRNTREVVFGFSESRADAVQRAGRALADIPRSGELIALYRRQLDMIALEPEQHLPAGGKQSVELAALGALDWIVPPGVRARIALCNAWGM